MITKSLPHKKTNFRKVLDYVLKEFRTGNDSFAIFHNLSSTEPVEVAHEFRQNYALKDQRSNGNALYHEFLSFSPKDSAELTAEKIEDITRKYIKLRCQNSLVVASLHRDKKHLHVHLMISANEYLSRKPLRLSKAEFREIQVETERYHLEKYPELKHSFAFLKEQKQELDQDKTKKSKIGRKSKKELLKTLLKEAFENAKGLNDFFEKLKEKELETYEYRGKLTGIWSENKKYRFKTLGIMPEHLKTLERMEELKQLNQQNKDRGEDLER